MKIINILIFYILISTVSAFNVTVLTLDVNTLEPIFNVSVEITNETDLNIIQYTDVNGQTIFELDDLPYYWYNLKFNNPNYNELEKSNNISDDTTEIISMFPFSQNGIIRIIYNDITLTGDHELCFYFEENNRLKDCYKVNETIQLVVNKNYIVRPKVTFRSQFESAKSLSEWMVFIGGTLFGGIFGVVIILFIVYIVGKVWKK